MAQHPPREQGRPEPARLGFEPSAISPCPKSIAASTFPPPAFGGSWRRFPAPASSSRSATWRPRQLATDLQGGAQFGYALLSVILISNFMAILLQHLCIKLGIVTGRDLAQACRDHYPMPVVWFQWILCEIAIAACDLAEVVGSAIGLQLLFGIPLVWGCFIMCADVLAVLYLQNKGFRYIEALVAVLIGTIGACFAAELFWSKPSLTGVLSRIRPPPPIS